MCTVCVARHVPRLFTSAGPDGRPPSAAVRNPSTLGVMEAVYARLPQLGDADWRVAVWEKGEKQALSSRPIPRQTDTWVDESDRHMDLEIRHMDASIIMFTHLFLLSVCQNGEPGEDIETFQYRIDAPSHPPLHSS